MSPDCGTQKISRPIRPPARYSGCCGPGTFVATADRLGREQVDGRGLHRAGSMPSAGHQAEREHRLVRTLELPTSPRARRTGARADRGCRSAARGTRGRSGCRATAAPRGSRRLTGTVARIAGRRCPRRAAQVAPSAPAAVDIRRSLTVQPSARATDLTSVQRQRIGPRGNLARAERALEARRRIVGERRDAGELARDAERVARELAGLLRDCA